MGEDTDSSIYRRPRYPRVMEPIYSRDTGRYVQMTDQLMAVLPTKISKAACRPITTPTAMTIFRWLYLSLPSRQPILEKRSLPLQHRRAVRESQSHMGKYPFILNQCKV